MYQKKDRYLLISAGVDKNRQKWGERCKWKLFLSIIISTSANKRECNVLHTSGSMSWHHRFSFFPRKQLTTQKQKLKQIIIDLQTILKWNQKGEQKLIFGVVKSPPFCGCTTASHRVFSRCTFMVARLIRYYCAEKLQRSKAIRKS